MVVSIKHQITCDKYVDDNILNIKIMQTVLLLMLPIVYVAVYSRCTELVLDLYGHIVSAHGSRESCKLMNVISSNN